MTIFIRYYSTPRNLNEYWVGYQKVENNFRILKEREEKSKEFYDLMYNFFYFRHFYAIQPDDILEPEEQSFVNSYVQWLKSKKPLFYEFYIEYKHVQSDPITARYYSGLSVIIYII